MFSPAASAAPVRTVERRAASAAMAAEKRGEEEDEAGSAAAATVAATAAAASLRGFAAQKDARGVDGADQGVVGVFVVLLELAPVAAAGGEEEGRRGGGGRRGRRRFRRRRRRDRWQSWCPLRSLLLAAPPGDQRLFFDVHCVLGLCSHSSESSRNSAFWEEAGIIRVPSERGGEGNKNSRQKWLWCPFYFSLCCCCCW